MLASQQSLKLPVLPDLNGIRGIETSYGGEVVFFWGEGEGLVTSPTPEISRAAVADGFNLALLYRLILEGDIFVMSSDLNGITAVVRNSDFNVFRL